MRALAAVSAGFNFVGRSAVMMWQVIKVLPRPRLYMTSALQQAYVMGILSLPLVLFMAALGGAVTSQQTGAQFTGGLPLWVVGSVLAASVITELGPLLTAIVMMARIGAAIAAELASMKVYQEVDALETMNIPAARILVLPRLAAIVVMMPVLTMIGDIIGWFGGAIVSQYTASIGIASEAYFAAMRQYMEFDDVLNGLMKAEVFGTTVVLVCCNIGLQTRGGPREIGASVTKAVVVSLILIQVLDYVLSKLLI